MRILIKNGRVIDPANNLDETLDILIEDGKIAQISKNIKNPADKIINAKDKIVAPGLIDMHVHLREPGREDEETIESGTKAALYRGITSLLAMPNTNPAIDCIDNLRQLKEIINSSAANNVYLCATITKNREGRELTDFTQLKKEGAIAISDDGSSVDDPKLMLQALENAHKEGLLVISHCEDVSISKKGVVHYGFTSTRMGLRGIPSEAEYQRVERDIELASKTGASLHLAHLSCKESVEIVAKAKKKGIRVTCEVSPHHLTLTEEAVLGYDSNFKMNPPLRSKEDMLALRRGLKEGIIDVVASDHAPHTDNEKEIEFERAEFGVIGLETELSVCATELVSNGFLGWGELIEKFTINPARILGIEKGRISVGSSAELIIIDPEKEWVVKKEELISKSKNSPFLGKKLKSKVVCSVLKGRVVFLDNSVLKD